MYADVLIEYSAKAIDQTFTYIIPDRLKEDLKIGMKVLVPFGNKIINGFVTNIKNNYTDTYELKEINDIVDKYFCLNEEMMELGKYLQAKTLCTKIAAYQTMLPSSLKVKEQKSNYSKYLTYIELNKDIKEIDEYIENNKRSKKQVEILNTLKEGKALKSSFSQSSVKTLLEKELIKITNVQIYRLNNHEAQNIQIEFSEDQEKALETIDLNSDKTYLLHGITGSGKTEVYIELIKRVVKNGKKAILLVPEISLTAQIVNKFYDRFGDDVAIFHSGLSAGEKYDEYLKILREEVHIVIGTRSAIFTPITKLGLIIIDEEHSETYKQDTTPRYHARDMAEFRKNYNHIPLVLGSATPSLETMARALKGVYTYIPMNHRIGTSILPTVQIIDMSEELKKRNMIFSDTLKNKIRDRLIKKEQVILLLNRRGYSTVISCKSCGYTYKCPHCDITLTYHKTTNNLRCHYCGYTVFKSEECPECKEKALYDYGLGTEKLEQELSKLFPEARIVRMDADTTKNKGSHEDIINKFKDHEYDILLGTQMISKGLDFPLVTLVGVINADATLNIPDFRSGERTFSLLSQVAGRAGRSNLLGEVILQTFNPDSFTLKCVQEQDYMKLYNYEMKNRHKLDYPPYYYLTSIKVASKEYELASKEITKIKNYLEKKLSNKTIILGPTTANPFRINNIYRFQIILKYKIESNLMNTLKELDELYMTNNKVNIEIDNNPLQV
ncbi:MAG: primosomal protein N' [Bacilli bacterium]|nr:primosomal protein N' [Bacilli bacterium]